MNQQNRVGGHRTVCTLHRSFASVRSAAVKMKRELQEKGLDVLCNNAGIMGDLDILVAQPLKHRQDGHPLPSNSSHPYLRLALLSPPKKNYLEKIHGREKYTSRGESSPLSEKKSPFRGKNPSTLLRQGDTKSYIRSPRKNSTAMNRKC